MADQPVWRAPVVVTSSRWLRQEVYQGDQQAGCEFQFTGYIPQARSNARRRPMLIVGADLVSRATHSPLLAEHAVRLPLGVLAEQVPDIRNVPLVAAYRGEHIDHRLHPDRD